MVATPSSAAGTALRTWLALGPGLDVEAWARRHAAGEVPDAWPYGLDRLAGHGLDPRPRPPMGSVDLLAGRAARKAGGYQWWEAARQPPPPTAESVLCWDERSGVPLALSARDQPLATGVIWLTERRSRLDAVARTALRRAGAVWALSSAQLPVLRDAWGVPGRRLHHLTFGIDADFFVPAAAPPITGSVISVGNDRHRDHATVVAAMADVQRRHPAADLTLVTRAEVDVPPHLGRRTPSLAHGALRQAYGQACVVAVGLLPNLHVSGITVALEAMACARPVVVSDTPGMADYVIDGVTGILVPPGDRGAMAAAIGSLLDEPARAAAMGEAGRRAVEASYSTDRQAAALAEIVRAALG